MKLNAPAWLPSTFCDIAGGKSYQAEPDRSSRRLRDGGSCPSQTVVHRATGRAVEVVDGGVEAHPQAEAFPWARSKAEELSGVVTATRCGEQGIKGAAQAHRPDFKVEIGKTAVGGDAGNRVKGVRREPVKRHGKLERRGCAFERCERVGIHSAEGELAEIPAERDQARAAGETGDIGSAKDGDVGGATEIEAAGAGAVVECLSGHKGAAGAGELAVIPALGAGGRGHEHGADHAGVERLGLGQVVGPGADEFLEQADAAGDDRRGEAGAARGEGEIKVVRGCHEVAKGGLEATGGLEVGGEGEVFARCGDMHGGARGGRYGVG